jgi:hypothetical protein
MTTTWLEAIAYERDHADAEWEHAGRVGRRLLVLAVLADQSVRAQSSLDLDVRPRKPYVSAYMLAAAVAASLGISGARRLGSGAKGGQSWTGYMSNALRVSPTLEALRKAKLVRSMIDPDDRRTRYLYAITPAGLDYLTERT